MIPFWTRFLTHMSLAIIHFHSYKLLNKNYLIFFEIYLI